MWWVVVTLVTAVAVPLVAVVVAMVLTVRNPARRRAIEALKDVSGPAQMPFIGTSYLFLLLDRKETFRRIETVTRIFKPILQTWNGKYPEVHISQAEHIEVVLRNSVNISKGFTYEFLKPWLGTGLLTSTGEKWHTQRKLITPTFHFKILENFHDVFVEKSQVLVQKLEKEIGNEDGFEIYPYITKCALDIICETAMGIVLNAQNDATSPYPSAIYDVSELVINRFMRPWLHPDFIYFRTKDGRRYKECIDILHTLSRRVIRERKRSMITGESNNEKYDEIGAKRRVAFLDLLLKASEDGAELSDEDIREEVDTFMFEGHDTTTASLCWTLSLLGSHPEVQEKVFEEQQAIFGDSDRLPTTQDLNEMKYLERVIKESLRLYPSVPMIMRQVTEDIHLGNYLIPKHCSVIVNIYSAHRNPRHFSNAEEFDPDRFLPERVQGRHPYAYVPFSAGPRNCIGQKFALLEEKTVLSAVVRRFRLRALDLPENVRVLGELILRPADPLRLALRPRATSDDA